MVVNSRSDPDIALTPLVPAFSSIKPAKRLKSLSSWRDWAWELAALIFAILTLPALVVLIMYITALGVARFGQSITVNAIILILANIFAACVGLVIASCMAQLKWLHFRSHPRPLVELYNLDQASHGIFGALKLLFWNPVASPLIILTASLLCIKGLVGPALQQIIHQGLQAQNLTNSQYIISAGKGFTPLATEPTNTYPDLESAVLQGLLETKIQPFNVTPTVPSSAGNATWTRNWTLAVCSECQDISDLISATPHTGSSSLYWSLSLPNGHSLDTSPEPGKYDFDPDSQPAQYGEYHMFNVSGGISQSVVFKDRNIVLSDFAAIFMPARASGQDQAKAWECNISFCAQQLTASLTDGNFVEDYIGAPQPFNDPCFDNDPAHTSWNPWRKDDGLVGAGNSMKSMTLTDGNNQTTVLEIEFVSSRSFAEILESAVFNGTIIGTVGGQVLGGDIPPSDRPFILKSDSEMAKTIYNAAFSMSPSANGIKSLKLPDLFGNVGRSIRASLRTRNGSSVALPAESTWKVSPLFEVRWGWIPFPVGVVVLISVVFALTWSQTSKRGAGTWKDSILATMFYGISDDVRGMPQQDMTLEELEGLAKQIRCQCPEDCTLELVEDAFHVSDAQNHSRGD